MGELQIFDAYFGMRGQRLEKTKESGRERQTYDAKADVLILDRTGYVYRTLIGSLGLRVTSLSSWRKHFTFKPSLSESICASMEKGRKKDALIAKSTRTM